MAGIDVEALGAPVSAHRPCGEDLEYDAAFLALEESARGKPEQQFGSTVIPAEDPDWQAMQKQALDLFGRTRDLRVAMHLLRAETRLGGISAATAVLQVMHDLLDRHWSDVYPALELDDGEDATMRMNALWLLASDDGFIGDLRGASVDGRRGGLTVRQLEIAARLAEPHAGESAPTEAGVIAALAGDEGVAPQARTGLIALRDAVARLDATLQERAGHAVAPDLGALRRLVAGIAGLAERAGAGTNAEVTQSSDAGGSVADGGAAPGGVDGSAGMAASRQQVLQSLDRACEWIARHEPTNPAPLLIRRAQRLMGKSFIEIIRDLAPDGLKDVERIAGIDAD